MIRKIVSKFLSDSGILPESDISKFVSYYTVYRRRTGILNSIKYALAICLDLSDECDCEDAIVPEKEEPPHDRDIS